MDYRELVISFNIRKGDRIWLSSELIKLALKFKKVGIRFDGSCLIRSEEHTSELQSH